MATIAMPNPTKRGLFDFLRGPQYTPEEKAAARAKREMEDQLRQKTEALIFECEECADIISVALARLGVAHQEHIDVRKFKTHKVKFEEFRFTEEALYLKIDMRPGALPYGIKKSDMGDPEIVDNLSISVGRKVEFRWAPESGAWYIVWRSVGARGIPTHVQYSTMYKYRPASAGNMDIPIGMTVGKKVLWRSLVDMQGMLIAGTTGGGKTNLIKVFITSLIRQNTPDKMLLALCDFKLVEFHFFKHLPHLYTFGDDKRPAYITDVDDIGPLLTSLKNEMERRAHLLEKAGVSNIRVYNSHRTKTHLPDIVFFVDELAEVLLHPQFKGDGRELLINLGSKGRAMGIRVILATQHPNRDVIDPRLKTVLPTVFAFPVPNISTSVMLLNSGAAADIGGHGRCVFQMGNENHEVQIPLINDSQVMKYVKDAIAGKVDTSAGVEGHDVDDNEIFEWSIKQNDSKLDERTIATEFAVRGMKLLDARDLIDRYEGKLVDVYGEIYRIERGSFRGASRLVKIDKETADPKELDTFYQEHGLMDIEPELEPEAPKAEPRGKPTDQEIFEWSVQDNDCQLSNKGILGGFKDRGLNTFSVNTWMSLQYGKTVKVFGDLYIVVKGTKGGKNPLPTRLELLDKAIRQPTSDELSESDITSDSSPNSLLDQQKPATATESAESGIPPADGWGVSGDLEPDTELGASDVNH